MKTSFEKLNLNLGLRPGLRPKIGFIQIEHVKYGYMITITRKSSLGYQLSL